jgi:hypothetical protein
MRNGHAEIRVRWGMGIAEVVLAQLFRDFGDSSGSSPRVREFYEN